MSNHRAFFFSAVPPSVAGSDHLGEGAALAQRVDAEGVDAKGDHLQQAAGHRELLRQVDELVLVTQRAVEGRGGHDREQRQAVATARTL